MTPHLWASRIRTPSERSIVAKGLAVAKSLGFFALKIHGNQYQMAGIPDVLCLKGGRAFWIEFKRPGEKPTKLQMHRMKQLEEAGCPTAVARSAADVRVFLEGVA